MTDSSPILITGAGIGRNAGFRAVLSLATLIGKPVRFLDLVDDSYSPSSGIGFNGIILVDTVAKLSGGYFKGRVGKSDLLFIPGRNIRSLSDDHCLDIRRQYSKSVSFLDNLLEVLLLPLSIDSSENNLILLGPTHMLGGFISDELIHVLIPNLRSLGLNIKYTEISPGFFPLNRGESLFNFGIGSKLRNIEMRKPFQIDRVRVEVVVSKLPIHLAEQALGGTLLRLKLRGIFAQGRIRKANGDKGLALLVWAQNLDEEIMRVGFAEVGQRGGRSNSMAINTTENLICFLDSKSGLPARLVAVLLPILVAARGVSRISVDSVSSALIGVIKAINLYLPGSIDVDKNSYDSFIELKINGIGLI